MCQNLKSEDPGSLQGKTNTAQIPNNKMLLIFNVLFYYGIYIILVILNNVI